MDWQRFSNPIGRRRYLSRVGDVNPIEYGGGFVIGIKRAGEPEYAVIEFVHEEEDADKKTRTIYSEHVPEGDVFEYYDWAKPEDMASALGVSTTELREMGASDNLVHKAAAVVEIANYYGWHELDQYPLEVTVSDLRKHWRTGLNKPYGWHELDQYPL